jgi:SAM-dependent methyltransferase
VSERDVFLDLGSGMGRVVFLAALHYPFKRVVGVELSPDLHRIAEGNIARNRPRFASREVELVCGDVLDYEIPDDVTVVFLASPFTGAIFQAVADRLLDSVDRAPRRLRLIYFNPTEEDRLLRTGRVRVVKRVRGWRPGSEWSRWNTTHVYEVLPRSR